MKEKVALAACQTYNQAEIENAVAELFAVWGGVGALVSPGETVLLKPNIVEGLPPERAVTTHPYVVHEVLFFKEALSSSSGQSGVFQ